MKGIPGVQVIRQPIRGCGKRSPGGTYLRSKEGSSEGAIPIISLIQPPVPTNRKAHRGAIVIDGDALLQCQPEEAWLAGSSAARAEKERGDQWAIDNFGMTATMRLATGDCKGLKTIEDALDHLVSLVAWDRRIVDYIRQMSMAEVQNLPNAAGPFARFVSAIQTYGVSENAASLVAAVAAIWRLADAVQPRHRGKVIRPLAGILVFMGLGKDARDLLIRYRP